MIANLMSEGDNDDEEGVCPPFSHRNCTLPTHPQYSQHAVLEAAQRALNPNRLRLELLGRREGLARLGAVARLVANRH